MRTRVLSGIFFVLLLSSCAKTRIKEHNEWAQYFEGNGIKNGCFILRDNNHESIHYFNKDRCIKRFSPAATFNIFSSLVALETAIAPDDQLMIKWDGVQRRHEWDKDMTMREAFKVSCLPYFQELARRIGPARMQHYLDTVKYGNMNMGGSLTDFWVNDSLKISADEQAGFVKRLYFAELPFSERSQRIVKTMMHQEETPAYALYYKKGIGKDNYWMVGFAERIEHVKENKESMNKVDIRNYPYFFAENFETPAADTTKNWSKISIDLVHQVLKSYGALPE